MLPRPWDSPGKNTGLGCHLLLQVMKVKSESEVTQLCLTLVTPWTAAYLLHPWDFLGKSTGVGCHCLLCWSHHFMANRWGKNGNSERLCLGGSKITANGDCSHEIKRCLLLGRKTMTNLDSILKSRDITLLTNIHLVNAMVFPVVMYGCESWTIKKAER